MSGFKALAQTTFQVPSRSLILIGGNGSGKSSTLQALGLVREFAHGNASKFFDERGWTRSSVRSRVARLPIFRVDLVFDSDEHGQFLWQFDWGLGSGRNRREVVWHLPLEATSPLRILDHNLRRTAIDVQRSTYLTGLKLPGSVLSFLALDREDPVHADLCEVVEWAQRITSLELLSPTAMRRGTRGATENIGNRGQRLASFLASLDSKSKNAVVRRLRKYYPLRDIETTRKRAGWVDMRISEKFGEIGKIGPSHASDGLLRLMAICAIPEFALQTSLVMLDEIEDGIEPHILPELVKQVVSESASQFIFTSHSPLLVNFFEPTDIHVLARRSDGSIATSLFSEVEPLQEGLEYFGPGELWSMAARNTLGTELSKLRRSRERNRLRNAVRFSVREAKELLESRQPQ